MGICHVLTHHTNSHGIVLQPSSGVLHYLMLGHILYMFVFCHVMLCYIVMLLASV